MRIWCHRSQKKTVFQREKKWSTVDWYSWKAQKIKNVHWIYQQKLVSDLGENGYSGQRRSLHLPQSCSWSFITCIDLVLPWTPLPPPGPRDTLWRLLTHTWSFTIIPTPHICWSCLPNMISSVRPRTMNTILSFSRQACYWKRGPWWTCISPQTVLLPNPW